MKLKNSKSFNFLIVLTICISFSIAFCFSAFAGTNVNLIFGDNNGIRNASEFEWLAEGTDFRLKNNSSKNVYDRFYLGWQKLPAQEGHKEGWYYFDENTGLMKTGWFNQGNKLYFLSLINDGSQLGCALNGWWLIDGKVYHLDETNYTLNSTLTVEDAKAKGIQYNDPTELLKSLLAKGNNAVFNTQSSTNNSNVGPLVSAAKNDNSYVAPKRSGAMQEDQIIRPTAEGNADNANATVQNKVTQVTSTPIVTNAQNNIMPEASSTPFVSVNTSTAFGSVASIRSPGDFVWEHELNSSIWKLRVWSDNPNEKRYYTGWQKIPEDVGFDGGWYHFNEGTAEMDTGWYHEDGKSYFFGMLAQKQNLGRALKGWWLLDGKVYHFNETNYILDNVCTVEEAVARGVVYNQ